MASREVAAWTKTPFFEDGGFSGDTPIYLFNAHVRDDLEEAAKLLNPDRTPIVGVDTESKAAPFLGNQAAANLTRAAVVRIPFLKKQPTPIGLIQVATPFEAILIRLHKVKTLPEILRELLQSPAVVKVFHDEQDDIPQLKTLGDISPQKCLSLVPAAQKKRCKKVSLSALAREFLDYDIRKDKRLTTSDWFSPHLTEAQLVYAANDALATLALAEHLLDLEIG